MRRELQRREHREFRRTQRMHALPCTCNKTCTCIARHRSDGVREELDACETTAQLVGDGLVPNCRPEHAADHVSGSGDREEGECEPDVAGHSEAGNRGSPHSGGVRDGISVPVHMTRPVTCQPRYQRADRSCRVEKSERRSQSREVRSGRGVEATRPRHPSLGCSAVGSASCGIGRADRRSAAGRAARDHSREPILGHREVSCDLFSDVVAGR